MRQRKRRQREASSEALIRKESTEEEIGDNGDEREKKGFYACYLLVSLSPRHKGHTYIGFTVNPRRRIRQHNGEIRCGAWRTKKRRPWEMVLCIHGFPSNVSALQFEWAWQHPNESLAVRKAAVSFKSLSGIANKIKLAYTMLTLPSWHSLNITVNYFSTKYTKHSAGCPGLPHHMKVKICPMDELPCYVKGDESLVENDYGWDNEERDEACSGSEIAEETLPDPMFGNAIKHDKNGLGDEMGNGLYGWLSEEAACGGSKIEACSGSEIAEETLPDPMFGNVIKHDKNSLGDEMGDGLYGWVSEETACGGRKIETLPDPMFWNVEEHDKTDLGNGIADGLYGWMSEGEDCREKSTHAGLLARPSSNASSSNTIVGAVVEDTGISGLVKDSSFPSKRPAKEISGFLVTIDDEQAPSGDIVPSEVEVIDVTTPSPLCRSSLWDKKFNKGGGNKEHRNMPSEAEVIDLTTPPSLCRSSLWSDLINYA